MYYQAAPRNTSVKNPDRPRQRRRTAHPSSDGGCAGKRVFHPQFTHNLSTGCSCSSPLAGPVGVFYRSVTRCCLILHLVFFVEVWHALCSAPRVDTMPTVSALSGSSLWSSSRGTFLLSKTTSAWPS